MNRSKKSYRFGYDENGVLIDYLNDKIARVKDLCDCYEDLWEDCRKLKNENGKLVERSYNLEHKLKYVNHDYRELENKNRQLHLDLIKAITERDSLQSKNDRAAKKIGELVQENKKLKEECELDNKEDESDDKIVISAVVNHPKPTDEQNAYGGFSQPPKSWHADDYVNYMHRTYNKNGEVK